MVSDSSILEVVGPDLRAAPGTRIPHARLLALAPLIDLACQSLARSLAIGSLITPVDEDLQTGGCMTKTHGARRLVLVLTPFAVTPLKGLD